MIKVVIVDDVLILRNGLKTLIEQDPEIKVVADCCNGFEAVEICRVHVPDVVLMDIRMPICDGVEGTRLVKKVNSAIKVIILTLFNDPDKISEAINNGADGFLLKDINEINLINAIKSTMNGLNIVHQSLFENMKRQLSFKRDIVENRNKKVNLTEREKNIIRMIIDGKSNKEIANTLHFAEGSVRNAISLILDKLDLKDRTQLAIFAINNELV